MRIAVNARFLLSNKLEGIGRFTFETMQRITHQHPEHEFIFLFDRPYSNEFVFADNVKPVVLFPQARHPFLYYFFFNFSVTRALKKHKADVFVSTDGYLSLRTQVPQLAVMHDLAFLHFKEGINKLEYWYYTYFFPKYAHKAARLVAVSNYTKQDIINQFNINPNKIDVIYNAPSEGFKSVDDGLKKEIRQKFSVNCPYFCYVGAMHPRKNIEMLLRAFDAYKTLIPNNFKLVIVGRKAWKSKSIEEAFNQMKHQQDVIFTGRVADSDLHQIIAAAEVMVYIPLFEGFGLPIIEAMACNVPVITSNVTSMPEVAGNAGVLVSPYELSQVTEAMVKLTTQQDFYQQKKLASAQRKQDFSWDVSAQQLWDSIVLAATVKI
ncbi:MAG: glycosyltransferase family 1 protein [Bacteroidetes bacterium]|nr:MAG: glycosyltransferase family 1 protein [Bacteroidota bacterium]